jgi:hypothetical protein
MDFVVRRDHPLSQSNPDTHTHTHTVRGRHSNTTNPDPHTNTVRDNHASCFTDPHTNSDASGADS